MKKVIISALCLIGCFVVCIQPVYADDSDNIKTGDRIEIVYGALLTDIENAGFVNRSITEDLIQTSKSYVCDFLQKKYSISKSDAGHTYPKDQTSKLYGANTYEFSQMQADHIKPWSKGGKTELSNCQMLCKWHNEHKSDN